MSEANDAAEALARRRAKFGTPGPSITGGKATAPVERTPPAVKQRPMASAPSSLQPQHQQHGSLYQNRDGGGGSIPQRYGGGGSIPQRYGGASAAGSLGPQPAPYQHANLSGGSYYNTRVVGSVRIGGPVSQQHDANHHNHHGVRRGGYAQGVMSAENTGLGSGLSPRAVLGGGGVGGGHYPHPQQDDRPAYLDSREGFEVRGQWRTKEEVAGGLGSSRGREYLDGRRDVKKFGTICIFWQRDGRCDKPNCHFQHPPRTEEDRAKAQALEALLGGGSSRPITPEVEQQGLGNITGQFRRERGDRDDRHGDKRRRSPRDRDSRDDHRLRRHRSRSRSPRRGEATYRRPMADTGLGRSMTVAISGGRGRSDDSGYSYAQPEMMPPGATRAPRRTKSHSSSTGLGEDDRRHHHHSHHQHGSSDSSRFPKPMRRRRPQPELYIDRYEHPERPFAVHENPSRNQAMLVQDALDDAPSYRLALASQAGPHTPSTPSTPSSGTAAAPTLPMFGLDPSLKGDILFKRVLSLQELSTPIKTMTDLTALHKLEMKRTVLEENAMDAVRPNMRTWSLVGKENKYHEKPPHLATCHKVSIAANTYIRQKKELEEKQQREADTGEDLGTDVLPEPRRPSCVSTIGVQLPQYIPWLRKVDRVLGDHKAVVAAPAGTTDAQGTPVNHIPNPSPTATHNIQAMVVKQAQLREAWSKWDAAKKEGAAAKTTSASGKAAPELSIEVDGDAPAKKRRRTGM